MEQYRFKEGDFVICKPKDETKINKNNKDFIVYARVVAVDRDNDTVVLDRYLKEGRLHNNVAKENNGLSSLPLSRLEDDNYYVPMSDDEILRFRNGLAELVEGKILGRKSLFLVYENEKLTLEAANKAAEEIGKGNMCIAHTEERDL